MSSPGTLSSSGGTTYGRIISLLLLHEKPSVVPVTMLASFKNSLLFT
jgi:hypothetical protein